MTRQEHFETMFRQKHSHLTYGSLYVEHNIFLNVFVHRFEQRFSSGESYQICQCSNLKTEILFLGNILLKAARVQLRRFAA